MNKDILQRNKALINNFLYFRVDKNSLRITTIFLLSMPEVIWEIDATFNNTE